MPGAEQRESGKAFLFLDSKQAAGWKAEDRDEKVKRGRERARKKKNLWGKKTIQKRKKDKIKYVIKERKKSDL